MHELSDYTPIGGLNYDDSDFLINHDAAGNPLPWQDSRHTRNLRASINKTLKGGANVNIPSSYKIGQYLLPYNGNQALGGYSKCIGAFEDVKEKTVIACIWNSEGKHQIWRYYRDITNPTNPYGEVQQIIQYDFGWRKNQRITSGCIVYGDPNGTGAGDLFYWCDPIPRKINLSKANICTKQKTWTVTGGVTNTFTLAQNFRFTLADFAGNIIVSTNIPLTPFDSNEEGLQYIADQINANYSSKITAVACDCSITITEVGSNGFGFALLDVNLKIWALNWYGVQLPYRYFDRCKWPELNAPQCTYLQDTSFLPNYVKERVFQFRVRLFYDDLERSVLGTWSQIPINNLGCDGTSNELLNYIDINFNDILLTDSQTLVLVTRIEVIARELNTGKDKSVVQLDPCDFLDYVDGQWTAHYKFYNNIVSFPVDEATAAQEMDNVPLESGAEIEVKNKIVEGAVLEGYDAPECPVASYTIDFQENQTPKMYKVKFKIRVLTYGLSDQEVAGSDRQFATAFPTMNKYPFWQHANPDVNYTIERGGIFHDTLRTTNNYPFFGGGGFGTGAGGDFGIRAGMEDLFDQRMPEGGWPVYAAGTPYFSVSTQKSIGLPVDSVGALDTSTEGRRNGIGAYLYGGGDLYSEVEILVPAGEYVFRMASHWCSNGDVLGKGFNYDISAGTAYQQTSTNVWGVFAPGSGTTPQYDPGSFLPTKEIRLIVTGDNDDAGTFLVMDVAPPFDFVLDGSENADNWQMINMYLVDSFGEIDPNAIGFNGVTVEKAVVIYENAIGYTSACTTDHNGYYFGIAISMSTQDAYQVGPNLITRTQTINRGTISQMYTKTLQPFDYGSTTPPPDFPGLVFGVVTTTNQSARQLCSTFIEGDTVNSSGDAVGGVLVVYENGRTTVSNADGSYSMIAWGDMLVCNLPNFPLTTVPRPMTSDDNRIFDSLIYELGVACVPVYPDGQSVLIAITPIGDGNPGDYSPDNPFIAPDFIVNENNNPAEKAHKRGGKYLYTIRYYDNAGRFCSPVKIFEPYVPFITEDLNVALPDQYPAGTYIYGKPVINWSLNYAPPIWAAKYQFMRSKNLTYGRYLQWVANEVAYLSQVATDTLPEITTDFANKDALYIKISLSNIVSYQAANNDSLVGYSYEPNDRLRLIADRSINFYQGINDFEITSYDSVLQSIIVKTGGFATEIQSGTLLEIFNPESVVSDLDQTVYEVGEVYDCTNPGQPNNAHGTTSGTFTNGDTYWRGRLIIVNDTANKFSAAYPPVIEDASISDFYSSEAQDIGRPGVIDPAFKQIYRQSTMKASGTYLPGTAINGLSTFDDNIGDEATIDARYGAIERLMFEQNNLVAICRTREVSNYIDREVLYQAESSQGVVSLSGKFFGTQYIHAQQLGTSHPATVVSNSGKIFGYNSILGNVWRYQGDGEAVISDVKMITFFNELSNLGISDAVAAYDRFHEELIITYRKNVEQEVRLVAVQPQSGAYNFTFFVDPITGMQVNDDVVIQFLRRDTNTWENFEGTITSITAGTPSTVIIREETNETIDMDTFDLQPTLKYSIPETIVWFEGNESMRGMAGINRWRYFHDATPEMWCSIGSEMIAIYNGEVYFMDSEPQFVNPKYNNFFGVQYESVFTPVFNPRPQFMKAWNAIWMKNVQGNRLNGWYSPVVSNIYGQLSRLKAANWDKQQNNWGIQFQGDITDNTVQYPILDGQPLLSEALTVEFRNDYTDEINMYGLRVNTTLAELTQHNGR